jgi:molybdate transport system permease protein
VPGRETAVTTLAVLALLMLAAPLAGLVLQAPWGSAGELLRDEAVQSALRVSLVSSVGSLALSMMLGLPLAWVLARRQFRGAGVVWALTLLPMVLPPVVGGVALLLAFGRRGLVGEPLAQLTGITLPFTLAGVVLAGAFVAMPFLVVPVEAALRTADRRLEEAAATLGARDFYTFRRVTLPMIAPALGAGMGLCWARALGEFGATITFAGNLPGRTQTMPLAVYLALESRPEAAYLMSLILLGLSAAVLLGVGYRFLGGR